VDYIGHSQIIMQRAFLSDEWKKFDIRDRTKWNAPIPAATPLGIKGLFSIDPAFQEHFTLTTFELMTNFVTADFAGRLSMGFTDFWSNPGKVIHFGFSAPLYPTDWPAKAVVKLHYTETSTGTHYTAYLKCELGDVTRNVYGGSGGEYRDCEQAIFNPHAADYPSQASSGDLSGMGTVPTTQRAQETAQTPAVAQEMTSGTEHGMAPVAQAGPGGPAKTCPSCHAQNDANARFCSSCGYSYSATPPHTQAPIPQAFQPPPQVAPPPPQIVWAPTPPPPQAVKVQAEKKGPGCLGIALGLVTIVGAIGMAILLAVLPNWQYTPTPAELALVGAWAIDVLLGLIGGIVSLFAARAAGKVMCVIFWILGILMFAGFTLVG